MLFIISLIIVQCTVIVQKVRRQSHYHNFWREPSTA
jgi:hypothetical protein